jgi:hypothetical protein
MAELRRLIERLGKLRLVAGDAQRRQAEQIARAIQRKSSVILADIRDLMMRLKK